LSLFLLFILFYVIFFSHVIFCTWICYFLYYLLLYSSIWWSKVSFFVIKCTFLGDHFAIKIFGNQKYLFLVIISWRTHFDDRMYLFWWSKIFIPRIFHLFYLLNVFDILNKPSKTHLYGYYCLFITDVEVVQLRKSR